MIYAFISLLFASTVIGAPSFTSVKEAHRPSETWILDRHGELVHEIRRNDRRRVLEWVKLAEISPEMIRVLLRAEDKRFFEHGGVDFWALCGVLLRLFKFEKPRGASTLTMQLAAFLETDGKRHRRSFWQKAKQIWRAWELERHWSKNEILEAYLNRVTFRGEVEGIAAASRGLFAKAPESLSEPEAAVLASLIRAPNAKPEAVSKRACRLVSPVNCAEVDEKTRVALDEPYRLLPRVALAPHIAVKLVAQKKGSRLYSTLDRGMQRWANEALRRHLIPLKDRHVADGALLIVDNDSGEILAYVGSSGDLSLTPHVDGVLAPRQAGSSLKPFLYALAFERRLMTPATLLDDSPTDIPVAGGVYRPRNYDHQFQGPVSSRYALGSSLNVPAVRALMAVGVDSFVDRLGQLGFTELRDVDYYGPSLALGAADVTLWELANAYRTLANGGMFSNLKYSLEPALATESRRAIDEGASFLIGDILSDRQARSLTFGLESPLGTRFWSAVKTGTSKDMRDNWCIGYSRRYTVAVWVGNFSGDPMWNVSGVSGAAPLWVETMKWLHREVASVAPSVPPSVAARAARIAGEPTRQEYFLEGTVPMQPGRVARAIPRITYPSPGMLVALDPDMPLAHQSLFFEANVVSNDLHWVLDGKPRGAISQPLKWSPRPGKHVVKLVDSKAAEMDSVHFEVRGNHGGER